MITDKESIAWHRHLYDDYQDRINFLENVCYFYQATIQSLHGLPKGDWWGEHLVLDMFSRVLEYAQKQADVSLKWFIFYCSSIKTARDYTRAEIMEELANYFEEDLQGAIKALLSEQSDHYREEFE